MEYEGIVYRPPSEANSLIVQVTIGCSHNSCTFCSMYKGKQFRIKDMSTILNELKEFRKMYKVVKRIFLADGDAFILSTNHLMRILDEINILFPECERISSYATPKDILNKSDQEIEMLKNNGLTLLYMGVESGSDLILKEINKGVTSKEITEAGQKAKRNGMKLSVTVISGIGGRENSSEHATQSAKVISNINPDYVGLLTLMAEKDTSMYDKIIASDMILLSPIEVMIETATFIENLEVTSCLFRSNHASNYVSLGGYLNKDKVKLLGEIKTYLNKTYSFKDEKHRML
ncbi:radical SAM protein [Fusibacter bizertensis]|uniref:Radical SAM protein n=1 Tax=Fusibacter bizertensis TaxID=1488331 RepID=A0ABT6NG36_9FIRM|nr:radical SAM protein [Fusibacter bizertensis]MDH8679399.1 radical SAM protein [Fusibacter bizertensis]